MRFRRRAAIALFAMTACKRAPEPPTPLEDGGDAGQVTATSAGALDSGLAPARCMFIEGDGARATLHDVGDPRSLVVGDAVATSSGLAVGIVHAPASGLEALVAGVAGVAVDEWVVGKRGELVPDAPPPKPLVAANALYAAYVARGAAGDNAALRRLVLKKAGVAAPVAAYPERTSESLTFDAALSADTTRAALVWDEDAAPGVGGITMAVVPLAGATPLAPRVVSGDTADPDVPRLAARAAGGWWVAWTAHRPEVMSDAGARSGALVEAPAEDRAYSWVELAIVGDDGVPTGPPRRVTPLQGHVASFDLAARTPASRVLDIVARDEAQIREGEGGRIVHVVVSADGSTEETATMVQVGVGRGSVDLLTGLGEVAWLAFPGAQDRTIVLPLGPSRAGVGAPSVEEVLEGGRLLTHLSSASSGRSPSSGADPARSEAARFIAAFPSADAASGPLFREVSCTQ